MIGAGVAGTYAAWRLKRARPRASVALLPGDDGGDNLAFVRGRLLRVRELADPGKVPYRLAPAERGLTPDQLRDRLRLRFGPSCGHAGARELETPVLGRALYTHDFWDLVSEVHSTEAHQLMLDCFPEVGNGTAALALRPNDLAAWPPDDGPGP